MTMLDVARPIRSGAPEFPANGLWSTAPWRWHDSSSPPPTQVAAGTGAARPLDAGPGETLAPSFLVGFSLVAVQASMMLLVLQPV